MPKAEERAQLIVNGSIFQDWKSVMVEHRHMAGYHVFEFTAAERKMMKADWGALQFKPNDLVTMKLAGITAMIGVITHREVVYDHPNHAVRLIGRSFQYDIARSSIKSQTGNYDKQSFSQIAKSLLAPYGCSLDEIGAVDQKPFKRCQVMPGERVYSFLSKLAAHRDIVLSASPDGKNLLAIGAHSGNAQDVLKEGVNILRANCEISNENIFSTNFGIGQEAGDDWVHGERSSKQFCEVPGSYPRYCPKVVPGDMAGEMYDLQKYTQFVARWSEGTKINAEITVQGWLRKGGDLWRIIDVGAVSNVFLDSPMLALQEPLCVKRVRFQQSRESGTTTMLELVAPWHLNSNADLSGNSASAFTAAPGMATAIN